MRPAVPIRKDSDATLTTIAAQGRNLSGLSTTSDPPKTPLVDGGKPQLKRINTGEMNGNVNSALPSIPFGPQELRYKLIGESYVDGFMDGEAVSSRPESKLRRIEQFFKLI
jgi:hypothetical protein